MFSARALATYLASEDYPERHLCPHLLSESPQVSETSMLPVTDDRAKKALKLHRKFASKSRKSVRFGETASPVDNEQKLLHPGVDSDVDSEVGSKPLHASPTPTKIAMNDQSATTKAVERDPKSFTQRLFDTKAFKMLQNLKTPDDYFLWQAWTHAKGAVRNLSAQRKDHHSQSSEHTKHRSGVATAFQDLAITENEAAISPKSSLSDEYAADNEKINESVVFSSKFGEHRQAQTSSETLEAQNSSLSPSISGLVPRHFFVNPTPPLVCYLPFRRAITLSHFTHQNIQALAGSIRKSSARFETYFLNCLGRSTPPMRLACPEGYRPQADKNVLLATQSIIYVFSNVEPILRSFKDGVSDHSSPKWSHLAPFVQLVCSMRQLMEIDLSHSNVFASLSICLGKLEKSMYAHRRGATNAKDKCFDAFRLDAADFVHIVRIVLAALVAVVPVHHVGHFSAFTRSLKAIISGYGPPRDTHFSGKVLEIMDVFDSEMSLKLLKRLVKVIMVRCARDAKRPTTSSNLDGRPDDVLDDWIELHRREGDYSSCSKTALQENNAKPGLVTFNYIIVEWLRMVLTKEWDGQARLSKGGPAWGAAEILSRLCSYILCKT